MFLTDGSSHHSGIDNELFVIEYLNAHPECELSKVLGGPLSHRGGTQTKTDAIVESTNTTISIKNHKDSGTFDWINTSSDIPNIKNIKKCLELIKTEVSDVEDARKHVSMVLSNVLFSETFSEFVSLKMKEAYDKNCDYIIVNDIKNKQLVGFPKTSIKHLFDEVTISPSTVPNRTSAKLNSHNMRVRFVLNNGVGALMKGRTSVPCLKLQQDQVNKFLDSITDSKTVVDYE